MDTHLVLFVSSVLKADRCYEYTVNKIYPMVALSYQGNQMNAEWKAWGAAEVFVSQQPNITQTTPHSLSGSWWIKKALPPEPITGPPESAPAFQNQIRWLTEHPN